MKKLLYLFLLFSFAVNSQVITVTPNSNATQLVNSILLNGACVGASNITTRTGTNFGSTNGIGSFVNINPSFPMSKGVILSTGNVVNAPGPNTTILDDGSVNWLGDASLVTALGNSAANYLNATVLEFDFNPISPKFSFDFIFASEEYGNFQCENYPDAFAFLLTNTVSGTTTNLAVLPATNTPISVDNVRDNLYNSTCSSVNANFFGNFYGGSNGNISPTNFNGETVLLTASAVLIPGTTYHIKLVIADRDDFRSDSAVFISGTSFNIGQDVLGPDVTIASGNAACFGSTYNITSGLSPAVYDFEWTLVGNTTILGTSSFLQVTSNGNYQLAYKKKLSSCLPEINNINIEFYPEINTTNPINISKCEIAGATTYSFNIAQNTPILLAGLPVLPSATTTIQYFSDVNCLNPIPSSYISVPNVTVYVKITNTLTSCFVIKPFLLLTKPETTIQTLTTPVLFCETTPNSTTSLVNFSNFDTTFLGIGQSVIEFNVLYYTTSSAAQIGGTSLPKDGYNVPNNAIIYVRVENKTDSGCFKTTQFTFTITQKPLITDTFSDKYVCTKYVLPALATPNAQYWSGTNGTGTQYFAGNIIIKPSTVNFVNIFIFLNTPSCPDQKAFKIIFIDVNDLVPPTENNCDKYIVPSLPYGNFYNVNLDGTRGTKLNAGEILTLATNPVMPINLILYFMSIDEVNCELSKAFKINITDSPVLPIFENIYKCSTEFYTLLPPDRVANPNVNYYNSQLFIPSNIIPDGTKIMATQTIFVHAESGLKPCTSDAIFKVFVGLPNPTVVSECEIYKLPVLSVGKYYPNLGGPSPMNVEITAGTEIKSSIRIYLYAKSDPNDLPISNCIYNEPIDIKIVLPIVPLSTEQLNVKACGEYTLPVLPIVPINTAVTPNQSYQQFSYNTKEDGTGNTIAASTIFRVNQTLYVFVSDGLCKKGTPLIITISPNPIIKLDNKYSKCQTFSLVKPANVEFYYGSNKTGGIIPDNTVFTKDISIYAYSTTSTTPPCELDYKIDIEIYFTKAIQYDNVTKCVSYTLPAIVQPADENNQYFSEPGGNPIYLLAAGTKITTTKTIFVYNRKTARFLCEDEKSFKVTIIATPKVNVADILLVNKTFCDTDDVNDGKILTDLYQYNSTILGTTQIATDFTVSYFEKESDAILNSKPITSPTFLKNVYVRVSNNLIDLSCYDIKPLNFIVNKLPEPTNPLKDVICVSNITGAILNSVNIDSGLSTNDYTFVWTKEASNVTISTSSGLTNIVTAGKYSVVATNKLTNCVSKPVTTEVVLAQIAIASYALNENFTDNQFVTVTATGVLGASGFYEYQLDQNGYQDSNIFTNVPYGNHTITVRDKNGCGIVELPIVVVNYLKFFTPNGDGNNDNWNVIGLENDLQSNVFIYDRSGKLITQIKPYDVGWDGKYNGELLPSTDYWFEVVYLENGIQKTFKAHFAMKR